MTADDNDKYPERSGRRWFVKGVVGGAALTGLGAATTTAMNTATSPSGKGGDKTQYFGLENTDGPAPRVMPQIPVRIDDEGFLKGLWPSVTEEQQAGKTFKITKTELGGITDSNEWFQHCGVQTYPGVEPNADQDAYFRYAQNPPYKWQQEEVDPGEKMHVDHFSDDETWGNTIDTDGVDKPAFGTWRSQDVPPTSTMPIQGDPGRAYRTGGP